MNKSPWLTSYSSWNSFRTCQEKFSWQYMKGYNPVDIPDYFVFGDMVHQGLQEWYGEGDGAMVELLAQIIIGREEDPQFRPLHEKASAMLHGYIKGGHWTRDPSDHKGKPSPIWRLRQADSTDSETYVHDELATHEVEKWFHCKIRNPASGRSSRTCMLRGKIDRIVSDSQGRFWCMEHKTCSPGFIKQYIDPRWYDLQSAAYVYAARDVLGYQVEGMIHNLMLKSGLRHGKKESDEEYYERLRADYEGERGEAKFIRVEKPISEAAINNVFGDLWGLTRLFKDAINTNTWIRDTGQCYWMSKECDYYDLCWGSEDPDYWMKFTKGRGMKRLGEPKEVSDGDKGRGADEGDGKCGDNEPSGSPAGPDGGGEKKDDGGFVPLATAIVSSGAYAKGSGKRNPQAGPNDSP